MKSFTKIVFGLTLMIMILSVPSLCLASTSLVNETVTVQNLGYRWFSFTLHAGDHIKGDFSVDNGDVNIYILDGANLAKYTAGDSFATYYKEQRVILASIDFTVPFDGTWAVILDNKYSLFTNKYVSINLNNESSFALSDYAGISSFLGMVVFVTVALVIRYTYTKSPNKPLPPPPPPTKSIFL